MKVLAVLVAVAGTSCQTDGSALSDAGRPDGAAVDAGPIGEPPAAPTAIAAAAIPVASTVALLAGSETEAGYVDATGSAARFQSPSDIAVDSAGNLYVGDSGRVRKITPAGAVTTLADVAFPAGVAVDASGTVYVHAYTRIQKVSRAGEVALVAGSGSLGSNDGNGLQASFDSQMGLGLDGAGNVLVADYENHRIRRVTPGGAVTTLAGADRGLINGPLASAKFDLPWDVAVDRVGNLYVADYGNSMVRKISGSTVTTLAVMSAPGGLGVDRAGNVYIARTGTFNRVSRITPTGAITTLAQDIPYARFATVDSTGTVYVTSGRGVARGGGSVRTITSVGIGELKVTWQAPSSETRITGYTATATAQGQEPQTCTSSGETTCTVRGLVTGVAYDLIVTATNAGGTSTPSTSVSATPN